MENGTQGYLFQNKKTNLEQDNPKQKMRHIERNDYNKWRIQIKQLISIEVASSQYKWMFITEKSENLILKES